MAQQFDYKKILQTYRKLQKQANQANEKRYQSILDTLADTREQVEQRYDEAEGLIEGLGDSARADIASREQNRLAQTEQDLISRGLGNTTIRGAMRRGVRAEADERRQELSERLAAQQADLALDRAAVERRMGQQLAGVMERRSDLGPDLDLMSSLLTQLGRARAAREVQSEPIFTGLSANARAGLDVFGNPMGDTDPVYNPQSEPGDPGRGARAIRLARQDAQTIDYSDPWDNNDPTIPDWMEPGFTGSLGNPDLGFTEELNLESNLPSRTPYSGLGSALGLNPSGAFGVGAALNSLPSGFKKLSQGTMGYGAAFSK